MILRTLIKASIRKSHVLKQNFHLSVPFRSPLTDSPNAHLDNSIFDRYMKIPIPESKTQVCYIWIDGSGIHMRCKSRILDFVPTTHEDVPIWNFDSCSTGQGTVNNSDCYLIPVAMYDDPLTRGNNKLILCETYNSKEEPTHTNHRRKCVETLCQYCEHQLQFGFEQEFLMLGPDRRPFGWPKNGNPAQDVIHYCGLGGNNTFGRVIVESFYRCCLYCGIEVFGINPEVVPSQWEFQTGPTLNIKAGDDLWMARWLIDRIAEDFGVAISYEPKLFPDLNGSGLHTNVSTKEMREENGLKGIEEAVQKLEYSHKDHMKLYDIRGGEDNKKRLTGNNETSHIDKFTWGIGDRTVSIRIPMTVAKNKKGYFEDRRPASNADPYQIINLLVKSMLS